MAYFNPDDINDSLTLLSGVSRQIENASGKVKNCYKYLDVRIRNNLSYDLNNACSVIDSNLSTCNNVQGNIKDVIEEYNSIMNGLTDIDLFDVDFSDMLENFSTLIENNYILNNISSLFISTTSTGAMLVSSGVHGLLNLVESLVDTVATGAMMSFYTPAITGDFLSYLITGKEFGFVKGLETAVKNFVQTEYVNNLFEDFYTNNFIGKYINDNAIDFVKSGSTVDQFIQTGAEVAGIIGISLLTAGVGGAAAGGSAAIAGNTTGIMATTAGLSGFGKEVEEAWNNGADTLAGIGAGAISGLWDGFQWWLGGNLAGQGLKAIGADVITAGVDMPLKSLIDSSSTGKDYLETFEANGGFQSILTSMTIAGLFSGFNEFKSSRMNSNVSKLEDGIDNSKQSHIEDIEYKRLKEHLDESKKYNQYVYENTSKDILQRREVFDNLSYKQRLEMLKNETKWNELESLELNLHTEAPSGGVTFSNEYNEWLKTATNLQKASEWSEGSKSLQTFLEWAMENDLKTTQCCRGHVEGNGYGYVAFDLKSNDLKKLSNIVDSGDVRIWNVGGSDEVNVALVYNYNNRVQAYSKFINLVESDTVNQAAIDKFETILELQNKIKNISAAEPEPAFVLVENGILKFNVFDRNLSSLLESSQKNTGATLAGLVKSELTGVHINNDTMSQINEAINIVDNYKEKLIDITIKGEE